MGYEIEWDESCEMSYGCWHCPKCGTAFYGGGPAIHKNGCELDGYAGLVYHFGPKELENVVIMNGTPPLSPRGLFEKIQAKYPDMIRGEAP